MSVFSVCFSTRCLQYSAGRLELAHPRLHPGVLHCSTSILCECKVSTLPTASVPVGHCYLCAVQVYKRNDHEPCKAYIVQVMSVIACHWKKSCSQLTEAYEAWSLSTYCSKHVHTYVYELGVMCKRCKVQPGQDDFSSWTFLPWGS